MIEFTAFVEEGIVRIPSIYRKKANNKFVKISLPVDITPKQHPRKKSAYGALAKYANPRRRKLEKEAWAMAAMEKHGLR